MKHKILRQEDDPAMWEKALEVGFVVSLSDPRQGKGPEGKWFMNEISEVRHAIVVGKAVMELVKKSVI